MDDFSAFKTLKASGHDAQAVCRSALEQGMGAVTTIRMLRSLFGLTLEEAKEVYIISTTSFQSLSDYQEALILPALEEALTNDSGG